MRVTTFLSVIGILLLATVIVLGVELTITGARLAESEDDVRCLENALLLEHVKQRSLAGETQALKGQVAMFEKVKGLAVMEVTYYSPTGRNTASGTPPVVGQTVAVDPEVIPLGTKVYIENIGWRIAEDTGPDIKGDRIDVFVQTSPEAKIGGRHNAYVIWKRE